MPTLTPTQNQILAYIKEYIDKNGYAPSMHEIGDKMKGMSTSGVTNNLNALQEAGLIVRNPRVARSIRLSTVKCQETKV